MRVLWFFFFQRRSRRYVFLSIITFGVIWMKIDQRKSVVSILRYKTSSFIWIILKSHKSRDLSDFSVIEYRSNHSIPLDFKDFDSIISYAIKNTRHKTKIFDHNKFHQIFERRFNSKEVEKSTWSFLKRRMSPSWIYWDLMYEKNHLLIFRSQVWGLEYNFIFRRTWISCREICDLVQILWKSFNIIKKIFRG